MFNPLQIFLKDQVLKMIDKDLKQLGLPTSQRNLEDQLSREMLREINYDEEQSDKHVEVSESLLATD
jgi:hypothetical protein